MHLFGCLIKPPQMPFPKGEGGLSMEPVARPLSSGTRLPATASLVPSCEAVSAQLTPTPKHPNESRF